jgi:hypothetical protein
MHRIIVIVVIVVSLALISLIQHNQAKKKLRSFGSWLDGLINLLGNQSYKLLEVERGCGPTNTGIITRLQRIMTCEVISYYEENSREGFVEEIDFKLSGLYASARLRFEDSQLQAWEWGWSSVSFETQSVHQDLALHLLWIVRSLKDNATESH